MNFALERLIAASKPAFRHRISLLLFVADPEPSETTHGFENFRRTLRACTPELTAWIEIL